jgi:hypothetical protein
VARTGSGGEVTRGKIREIREATPKPFLVNLLMSFPYEDELQVCLEERVPAVSFFWGDPSHPNLAAAPADCVIHNAKIALGGLGDGRSDVRTDLPRTRWMVG